MINNPPGPEVPVNVEKPKTNYVTKILIILCFVLFNIGAYSLGKKSMQLPKTIEVIPTVTPVAVLPKTTMVPTSIADPTSNWKTYSNNKLNLSFKYPAQYNLNDTLQSNIESIPTTHNYLELKDTKSGSSFTFMINPDGFGPFFSNKTVKIGYKQDLGIFEVSSEDSTSENTDPNVFSIIFNGEVSPAIRFLAFANIPSTETAKDDFVKLIIQILSTFKFTESKAEVPNNISNLFSAINSALKSNIPTTTENEFYSFAGNQTKKSWKIDLSKVINGKQQSNIVRDTLETKLNFKYTDSANGAAQNVDEFKSQKTICYYMYGLNTTGGPDTFSNASSYYYLTCSE